MLKSLLQGNDVHETVIDMYMDLLQVVTSNDVDGGIIRTETTSICVCVCVCLGQGVHCTNVPTLNIDSLTHH